MGFLWETAGEKKLKSIIVKKNKLNKELLKELEEQMKYAKYLENLLNLDDDK